MAYTPIQVGEILNELYFNTALTKEQIYTLLGQLDWDNPDEDGDIKYIWLFDDNTKVLIKAVKYSNGNYNLILLRDSVGNIYTGSTNTWNNTLITRIQTQILPSDTLTAVNAQQDIWGQIIAQADFAPSTLPTLNNQIERLQQAKVALKASITAKGVNVPESALIDTYPALIDQIKQESEHPTLNAPSISKSSNNLTITNPSTNGNFTKAYKIFSEGQELRTVETSPFVLTDLEQGKYVLTVKAVGNGFNDSADSNSLSATVYLQVNSISNMTTSYAFPKITNGMTISFTLVANEGYFLPPQIEISCNGEDLEFTYNPYTGAVSISALKAEYAGEITDGRKLATPTIELNKNKGYLLETTDVAFATGMAIYSDDEYVGTLDIPNAQYNIGYGGEGLTERKLIAPEIAIKGNDLEMWDSFLGKEGGDVKYSEQYEIYVDDVLTTTIASNPTA